MRKVEYAGQTWVLNDLAEAHGMKPATLKARLRKGMSMGEALATPVVHVEREGPDDRPRPDGKHWPSMSISRGSMRGR